MPLLKRTHHLPIYVTLALLLALGIWLRRQFIVTVQLYPDEFVTLLAVQLIGQKGLPIMPSGLFYEHGLLFSYLGSLATLFGDPRLTVRYASLVCGLLTVLLTFWVGRRWFSPGVGLLAAAGLALAPTAIEWSGRARMYALLQLLLLLALWLAFAGVTRRKAWLRWLALVAYLCATLAHFGAVALAPPLLLALLLLRRLQADGSRRRAIFYRGWWLEALAFIAMLGGAFLVKRAGQPKGIAALDGSPVAALSGLAEVLAIYSDVSFNVWGGWQAIAPFYVTLPALIFLPFALWAAGAAVIMSIRCWRDGSPLPPAAGATLYLAVLLAGTTIEMIFLVSPFRRDEKYLFMLLPLLFLLGACGMALLGHRLLRWLAPRRPRTAALRRWPAALTPIVVSVGLLWLTWGDIQALLANTGDDYDAAFAYVQAHWQPGDTVLTGTPAAAYLYLGRNDFYSVQRAGGYDYRLLTVEGQPVDRWLASPAIVTEAALAETLAEHSMWLVLERWGLQQEYYDLPFQQQLLAQTDLMTEAQGIFVLHSRANPRPLPPEPAQPVQATFGEAVQLSGYTIEPARPAPGQTLRLTLYWQALAPMAEDYTVFVHLRRPGGGNVAQADHRPLGSIYPTHLWPPGHTIRESSDLFLPPALPPGQYELWAGLYLLETGQRLPVRNDPSGENAVRLGEIPVQ
jgi:hypothetical protein